MRGLRLGAILTLAVSAYFLVTSYRVKNAFYLFIFLIPFLPKYIGFSLGGAPLSLIRILLLIFFIIVVISFMQNREYITKWTSKVYQQNKVLINLLLLFSILKIISLSLGSRELKQYIMLYNDFLLTGFVFVLTTLLVTSEEDIDRVAKMFFYGYVIVLLLVLIESFIKHPLLTIFMSGEMDLARDYSQSIFRGDHYRASGSLITPIALGEYLIVLFPIVTAYMYRRKYSLILKTVFFALFLYAIYATGSRGPVLMLAIMVYIYLLMFLYKGNQTIRFVTNVFNIIIVGAVFYFAFSYVSNLIANFHGRFDLLEGGEETISATSRALQYVRVYEIMQEAPFFGFGRLTNFSDFLGFTIDNRYFWMIMEVGIIGISVYFFFLFILVKMAFSLYKSPYRSYYVHPILLSILLYIPYKLLTVSPSNLLFLYIFAGMICVLKVLQNK